MSENWDWQTELERTPLPPPEVPLVTELRLRAAFVRLEQRLKKCEEFWRRYKEEGEFWLEEDDG